MPNSTIKALLGEIDVRLIETLLGLLRGGPRSVEWLACRARSRLRDARIDEEVVVAAVERCTLLAGRPDGQVVRLLDLLDGQVLTHRVSHRTQGRPDLWCTLSLMPILAWASHEPLTLATGGTAAGSDFGHSALVGPPGWLPAASPGHLLGFRVRGEQLVVEEIDPGLLDPDRDTAARQVLATHYRAEKWWAEDELAIRPGALNRAVGVSLLERPDLFTSPITPLGELLYDALHENDRLHQFWDLNAWQAGDTVSFGIRGMPEYLYAELQRRADRYDMSLDQYVLLALGHLAWRTPFAEDLGPWEMWDPDPDKHPIAQAVPLRSVSPATTDGP